MVENSSFESDASALQGIMYTRLTHFTSLTHRVFRIANTLTAVFGGSWEKKPETKVYKFLREPVKVISPGLTRKTFIMSIGVKS